MRKCLSVVLALLLAATAFFAFAAASAPPAAQPGAPAQPGGSSQTGSNTYNLVLVMDASGSLSSNSDPQRLRDEAAKLFIELLDDSQPNKLGYVRFATKVDEKVDLQTITPDVKTSVLTKIQSAPDPTKADDTNIGEALNVAVDMLKAEHAANPDVPNVIVFFSDGNTEILNGKGQRDAKKETASRELKDTAIQNARDEGIKVFSLCLNAGGTSRVDEMQAVATQTDGRFIEIHDSNDLPLASATLLQMLNQDAPPPDDDNGGRITIPSSGSLDAVFHVPGIGVNAINIVLYGPVTGYQVTKPDGSDAQCQEGMDSNAYQLLKIADVVRGEWKLHLTGTPGDEVGIQCLENTYLEVTAQAASAETILSPNDPYTITAVLKDDTKTAAADDYQGFEAKVNVRDKFGKVIRSEPMKVNGDHLEAALTMEEGAFKFDVDVDFDVDGKPGSEIHRASDVIGPIEFTLDPNLLPNDPPTVNPAVLEDKISLWPFKKNVKLYDLKQYFSDSQDPIEDLEVQLTSKTFDDKDFTYDPQTKELTVYSPGASKGDFRFTCYDTRGESVDFKVVLKINHIGRVTAIILGILVLLGAGALIFISVRLAGMRFRGPITITPQDTYNPVILDYPGKGKCILAKFSGLPNVGLDQRKSYFQAQAGNFITFVTDRPVTCGVSKPAKKMKIQAGREYMITVPNAPAGKPSAPKGNQGGKPGGGFGNNGQQGGGGFGGFGGNGGGFGGNGGGFGTNNGGGFGYGDGGFGDNGQNGGYSYDGFGNTGGSFGGNANDSYDGGYDDGGYSNGSISFTVLYEPKSGGKRKR